MHRAKLLSDKLASLQHPISNEDLVDAILDGLRGPLCDVYRTFATRTISFDDLLGALMTEERHLQREKLLCDDINLLAAHHTRFIAGNGRGRGCGRTNSRQSQVNSFPRNHQQSLLGAPQQTQFKYGHQSSSAPLDISTLRCHNCQGFGHMSRQCQTPRTNSYRNLPPYSNYTTVTPTDTNWLMDSGQPIT